MLCHLSFLAQKTVVHFEDVVHHTSVALLVAAKFQHVAMAATALATPAETQMDTMLTARDIAATSVDGC
jgi:hypothetical protein